MDQATRILWTMLIRLAKGMLKALEQWLDAKTGEREGG